MGQGCDRMMHKRQEKQPKPYWNIKLKSNKCPYWNSFTRECEHDKRSPNFGDFKCMKNKCPILVIRK